MNAVSAAEVNWDAYARCYDALTELVPYQELLASILQCVPKDARTILDVGCGTGTLLSLLAEVTDAQLLGVDNAKEMLEIAQAKLQGKRARLVQSDITSVGIWDGSYDVIVASNVLYTLQDPSRFLKRIYASLNAKGTAIVATPQCGYDNGLILKAHCRDLRPDDFWRDPHRSVEREHLLITEALGNGALAKSMETVALHNRRISQTKSYHFLTPAELSTLATDAGFRVDAMRPTYAEQNILAILKK